MRCYCVVPGCSNVLKPKSKVLFHDFPRGPRLSKLWLVAMGYTPTDKLKIQRKVCSDHFLKYDYKSTGMRVKLKQTAVPSIFPQAQVPSVQINAVDQQPTEISKGMTRLSDVAGKENSKHGTEGSSSSVEGKQTPVLYIGSQSANNLTAPTVLVDQTPFHPSRIHEYYCLSGSIQWSEGAWENVSSAKSRKGPCLPIQMSLRWQWLGMDVKGPLPATHDGNTYVLTVMDFYSKWVEAYPMKSLSAAEVALNIHSLICQLGFPHQILSRMKKTFLKEVNLALRTYLDAEACSLVVYHRDTCTLDLLTRSYIDSMVSELVNEHQKSWDVQLPASLFSLRCREHPSTHYSPFYMLYCKEPCTDLSIAGDEPFIEDQLEDDTTQPPSSTQGQDPELSNGADLITFDVKNDIEERDVPNGQIYTAEHTSLLDMLDVEEVLVVQCEQCAEWDRIPRVPEAQVQREDDVYTCVACRATTQRREEPRSKPGGALSLSAESGPEAPPAEAPHPGSEMSTDRC